MSDGITGFCRETEPIGCMCLCTEAYWKESARAVMPAGRFSGLHGGPAGVHPCGAGLAGRPTACMSRVS